MNNRKKIENKIYKVNQSKSKYQTKASKQKQINVLNEAKNIKNISNEQLKLYMNDVKIKRLKQETNVIELSNVLNKYIFKSKSKQLSKLINARPYLKALAMKEKDESTLALIESTRKAKKSRQIKLGMKSILYLFLVAYACITLYPFIWAIGGSFRPQSEFANAGLNPLPNHWTMSNFNYLFTNKNSHFNNWVWNSLLTSVLGVIVNLILNTLAGYALARFKFKGKNQIFWGMISLSMVPAQVLMIPNFLIVKNFGLFNNLLALVIPSAVNIGYIFMSRQFFLNFPREIEEAASIDGMSRIKTLWKIVVPLMRPMIITQSIFLFMGFWNNFLNAKIYMLDETKFTLTVGIQNLVSANSYNIEYGQILAASTISILPVFLIYMGLNGVILKGQRSDGDK